LAGRRKEKEGKKQKRKREELTENSAQKTVQMRVTYFRLETFNLKFSIEDPDPFVTVGFLK
jgi:hypothetical protein